MFEFALASIRSGIRGRSFQVVFLLGLVLIAVAYLSGGFSPRQPRTVALDIGISGLRFILVLLNLFWVQEFVAKEIERKTVIFSLAYPASRTAFLLGRFLGVAALSMLATIVMGLLLLIAVAFAGGNYWQEVPVNLGFPYLLCLFGVFLDAAVVAAFALFVAAVSTVAALPLLMGLGFAIGGKALGATLGYLAAGADGDRQLVETYARPLEFAQWMVPDLSRLDWRDSPLYGVSPDFLFYGAALLMAVSYIGLLLSIAALYFSRREFS